MSRRPLVWILDAHYQIFRAYYSMPDLRTPDGAAIGAFRGYTSALVKFLTKQAPTHVVAAYDHAMTSFRNELYESYKEGRTEAPEELEPQFELCAQVTQALGIPVRQLERYEADDVIATLVGALVDQGADVMIITADKDLGALVCDRVALFDLKKEEASGVKEMEARMGVPPELIPDFLTLVGDSVDSIPGVKGIGAKTAAALLNHFGSIEEIPRDAAEWVGVDLRGAKSIARKLAGADEAIALSRELVRMRDDLPIDSSLENFRYLGAEKAQLSALFGRLGVNKVLDRVPRFRE
ncbi:MAG: exodeoxyribonuclease IX [bacterium]|nr:exodeoxyribonuclease IX [bacterium]